MAREPEGVEPLILHQNNCAIRERTGDGESVGRCWFYLTNDQCPRHGDVSAVMAEYRKSGRLGEEAHE